MALTDVLKSSEAVWIPCEIPQFADEEFLLVPYTRETARGVFDESHAPEWRNNAIVREYDPNLFDPNFLRKVLKDWRGIPDPEHPGERLKGPGIRHRDGRIEYPAACTEDNKFILINSRPVDFYLWLQRAAEGLARAAQEQKAEARDTFRAVDSASPGLPEA